MKDVCVICSYYSCICTYQTAGSVPAPRRLAKVSWPAAGESPVAQKHDYTQLVKQRWRNSVGVRIQQGVTVLLGLGLMVASMKVGIIANVGFVQQFGPLSSHVNHEELNEFVSCPRSFTQGLTYALCVHSQSSDEGCCNSPQKSGWQQLIMQHYLPTNTKQSKLFNGPDAAGKNTPSVKPEP